MRANCAVCDRLGMFACSEKMADWDAVDEFAFSTGFARDTDGSYVSSSAYMTREIAWLACGAPTKKPCWRTKEYYADTQWSGEPSPVLEALLTQPGAK